MIVASLRINTRKSHSPWRCGEFRGREQDSDPGYYVKGKGREGSCLGQDWLRGPQYRAREGVGVAALAACCNQGCIYS